MSLYRKYRPQTFTDVVGQDHIVTTLEQAANQDKLAHAFLFAGSRGTGKTSVARILAKVLMIQGIEDEKVEQQIIKGVEEGSIVDLLEIDAASNRGIDDVRELIEKIQFSPVAATAKVYIIDEVHMLTKEAFNALLKTLEEPPAYAYFILATTELNKIPVTIQSRCQCFPFRRVPEADIIRRLQFISDQEKIDIDRDALRGIAHHVQGGMRDAISLLDQMRSLEKVTLQDIEQRIGGSGKEHVEAVFEAIGTKDKAALLATIKTVEEAGVPMDVFLRQLLTIVRETLHASIEEKKPTGSLLTMLDTLLNAIKDVRIAPVPGLVLEAALLSLCGSEEGGEVVMVKKEAKETIEAKESNTSTKLSASETKEAKEEATQPSEPVPTTEETESISNAEVEAPELSLDAMKANWEKIISETTPPSVKMSLKNGSVKEVDEKRVVVAFESTFHKEKVAETDASRKVEEVMEKIFKRHIQLECTIDQAPTPTKKEEVVDEEAVSLAEAAKEIF